MIIPNLPIKDVKVVESSKKGQNSYCFSCYKEINQFCTSESLGECSNCMLQVCSTCLKNDSPYKNEIFRFNHCEEECGFLSTFKAKVNTVDIFDK